MKKIKFKSISLVNFKGIKSLKIDFSDKTDISGANATGKTTIFDAVTWVLFGKDSLDRKDFNVKTLDENNEAIPRIDHEVTLVADVDGDEVSIKRVLKEKWVKRRGSEETEFTGHETEFFFNDVPCQAGEFQKKISDLCEEQLFKQITSPLYFNSVMKWQERRNALIRMAGNITDERVVNGNKAFADLMSQINGKKSLEEYKRELSAKKANLKKQLSDIPARIDELQRSNPEPQDWTAIEKEISEKQEAVKKIDEQLEDLSKVFQDQLSEMKAQQEKILKARKRMCEIESQMTLEADNKAAEANRDIAKALYDLRNISSQVQSLSVEYKNNQSKIESLENQAKVLRQRWHEENQKEIVFDENQFVCPACKRPFETSDIEEKKTELTANFNNRKAEMLSGISKDGKRIVDEEERLNKRNFDISDQLEKLQKEEHELGIISKREMAKPEPVNFESNLEWISLRGTASNEIQYPTIDNSELKEMKETIQEGINNLKSLLNGRDQIQRNNLRIKELEAEERKFAQELASCEKTEFTIDEFQKAKMNMIEASVNGMFKMVKFKLFETQINGGETPCCETMFNGVPFSDLNHAAQVNAGLDCINALSENYGVSAPVIIDNAESINEIIPVSGQLIRLIVSEDKKLRVSNVADEWSIRKAS
jgi:DNA repair exonuclease SbcCD ATPase subunit